MTLRQDLKDMLRIVPVAAQPPDDLQHLIASKGVIQRDARIAQKALFGVLPLQTRDWYLAGTATVANNQGGEYRTPQPIDVKRIDVIVKTPPAGSQLTIRLTNNGVEIPDSRTTVQPGAFAGVSVLTQHMNGGDVVRVDVIAVGSTTPGANITVTVVSLVTV